jgi:hypothetical protein
MKVFCPEHKRGFFAPRQNPIKCENRGHELGHLNFTGEKPAQAQLQWQYCCNCEHFCPISPRGESLQRCPVCTRRASLLYVCERCFTASFESNTPLNAKNFTLTAEGLPQPSCPGCLQTSSGEVREHFCDQIGASFSTALTSCPICRERLDVGPSFPALVEAYLRKTKAANKLTVTFDYDSALFVPVEDGEFVIVPNEAERNQSFVLPRLTRFSGPREFYEFYQDYYHHRSELQPGALLIHEPALVEPKREGWRFQTPGLLEVVADQPKPARKITASEVPPPPDMGAVTTAATPLNKIKPADIETFAPEEPPPAAVATNEGTPGRVCSHCGSTVEERYSFCWHCGKPMRPDQPGSQTAAAANPARRLVIDMDDASTAQQSGEEQSSIFSSDLPRQRKLRRGNSSGLKLLLVLVAVAGVLLAVGGFLRFSRSGSPLNASLTSQAMPANQQTDPVTLPTVEVADKPSVDSNQPNDRARENERPRPEDDALLKLREQRITASPVDRRNILQDFAKAEKRYPNDYRFPYEHAKLAVAGPQIKSFDAAFKALFVAAERAIKAGKAPEMLQGLQADKTGDFEKLSHGHSEWGQLVQALKNKDKKFLAANTRGRAIWHPDARQVFDFTARACLPERSALYMARPC